MSDVPRRRSLRIFATAALAPLVVLMSACQILPEAQPDRTRFFVLAAPMSAAATLGAEEATGSALGLRGIELPGYLRNTRSMVVARGPNEMNFRDDERWAEPLEVGLARVFRQSLEASAGVSRVTVFPFPSEQSRDYDLLVRILQCEGVDTGDGRRNIRFAASYDIMRAGAAGEVVKRGYFNAPNAEWDGEPGSLAARLAEAAAAAAAAIAAELP